MHLPAFPSSLSLSLSLRARSLLVALALPAGLIAGPWGCSSSSSSSPADASADGTFGNNPDGSYGGSSCGGSTCPVIPSQAAAYVTACCTADGGCGGQTPLSSACLPYGAVGGVDPSCPSYAAPTGTLPGCCRPDGTCGAFDGTLGLGCIANASLNQPAQACNYAANDCTAVTPITCDGPEDCPQGNTCCGLYSGGGYAKFACMPSCADAGAPGDAGGLALWFEMCHAGQTCHDSTTQCLSSTYLPSTLFRCYTTGNPPPPTATGGPGVNCGSTTCGAGEECCLRQPHDPYCAPSGSTCYCTGPVDAGAGGDGAATDGGVVADGGVADGGAADASTSDAAGD